MGSPVVHFEIHASDREALAKFYEAVFGWAMASAPGMPYTLIGPTGEPPTGQPPSAGIGGGMMDRRGPAPEAMAPVSGFCCIIQVDDLDAAYDAVVAHGGTIALEKDDIEGVGRGFYFKDPDGNIVGAMQPA